MDRLKKQVKNPRRPRKYKKPVQDLEPVLDDAKSVPPDLVQDNQELPQDLAENNESRHY